MKRLLLLTALISLPAASFAQAPAPSEKPAAPPAEKPMQHDMKGMRGMMGAMRAPVCLYEGKSYSRGALLNARGVKPLLECAPAAEAGAHADHGSGGAHGGHMPVPLAWQIYNPAKARHNH